ncbi:MAG: hypothetical protein ACPG5B_13590 [Chitinophagales bacterium]
MKKLASLFQLIKSLSKSEKRYFKVFVGKHSSGAEKNYVQLFDAIDRQNTFEEASLLHYLKSLKIKTTYLAADQNYLYKLILKSLRNYHAGKTISLKIKEELEYVEILFNKGLYQQCNKILQKAKAKTKKLDLYALLLETIAWEQKLAGVYQNFQAIENSIKNLTSTTNSLQNYNEYVALYHKSVLLRKSNNKARNEKSVQEFELFMQKKLLKSIEQAISFRSKIRFYEIYANFYHTTNQLLSEYENTIAISDIIEKQVGFIQEEPFFYMAISSRLLSLERKLKPANFKASLQKLRAIPSQVKKAKEELHIVINMLSYGEEMTLLLHHGFFSEALSLKKNIENLLKTQAQKIPASYKISAYYRFVYLHIGLGDFDNALTYINLLLGNFENSINPNLYSFARLLNLIIHYELGNFYLLEHIEKTTYNYFKRHQSLYKIEKRIFSFFRNIVYLKDIHHLQQDAFEQLWKDFKQLLEDKFEQRTLNYFDLLSWAESKATNQSFAQTVQKNNPLPQNLSLHDMLDSDILLK